MILPSLWGKEAGRRILCIPGIRLKKNIVLPKMLHPSLSTELSDTPAVSAGINIVIVAGERMVTPHKRFSDTIQSALSIITVEK